MSRIELNVVATGNFRNLETSVARLRTQVDALNASMLGVGFNSNLIKSISSFQDQFNTAIDQSGMFERHMVNLTTETTRFGRNLETGSMRLGQLFKSAAEYRRGELGQIRQLAREQVRLMNATTMRTAGGGTQVIVPRGIDEGLEKQRILNQEYRIFRQVVQNGSTEIINWGKNTQWAGRQLTVGLTVPLTMFGAAAGKAFMDADKQLTRLTKVYGDASKGMANSAELAKIRSETLALAQEIARTMGVAVDETLGVAADIAATGKQGNDLLGATQEAMRLSVLGEVDRQEAMRATLSIQNVFKKDTEGLTQSINLLNAVENQTSATINDLVTGIVKAGPVVKGLGGDVEDLAAMMVAMREGGVSASEAANAIKSSLASLINPTKQTTQVLGDFGIDIKSIVDRNAGDVIGTLMDLQTELAKLDQLSRQRAIEQVFGKFQFSRINALLSNLGKAGSQTEQVFAIASMSVADLARNAEQELTAVTESASGKFQRAIEGLKASLIPIGEVFLTVGTFIINVGNKILEVFNSLPDPVKMVVNGILGLTAVAGPLIMITGVLGNFFGYLVKGIGTLMAFKKEGRGAFELLTLESIAARDANELLSETLYDQSTAMNTMSSAVDTLVKKLEDLILSMKGVGIASGAMNMDLSAREAMAGAEAAAAGTASAAYGAPSGRYVSRPNKPTEITSEGVLYSHLTQNVRLQRSEAIPEKARSMVLGVGTVVDESLSELNRLLEVWQLDFSGLSDDTVTAMQRREAIMAAARKKFNSGADIDIAKIEQIVTGMSTSQLAQFAPTWQQISKQTANYFGTLKSMATLMETNSSEMAALFNQYRLEFDIVGPEQALRNLQRRLSDVGIQVQGHIDDVEKRIENIIKEVQLLPEDVRAGTLEQKLIELTGAVEGAALEQLQGLPGIGRSDVGYQRGMLLGAQSMTATDQQLINASKETLDAQEKLTKALLEQIEIQNRLNKIDEQILSKDNEIKKAKERLLQLQEKVIQDEEGNLRYKGSDGKQGRKLSAKEREKYISDISSEKEKIAELQAQKQSTEEIKRETEQRKLTSEQLIALRKKELSDLMQDDQIRNSVSDRLYAVMKALTMLREKEKAAIEKQVTAQLNLATAQTEAVEAQKKVLAAQTKAQQAWLTGGPNSPQYKAAQKELEIALELRAKAEKNVIVATKQVEVADEELVIAKRNSARTERIYEQRLREDTIAVDLDTEATKLSTAAELRQAIAAGENADVTSNNTKSTKKGSVFAGGKLGGAISMLSMAALFLPRPPEDTGAGQAANAGMNIANMAAMGSIFGGQGILAGAAIGGIIEGIQFLGRRAEETAKELEKVAATSEALRTGLTDVERQFFNIKPLKQLTDLPLDAFNFRTEEATNKLKEFAQALKEAEPGSTEAGRVTAISQMGSAQQFIDSPMFAKMVSEALLSGMSIEDVKIMVGGYLEAAGKQMFAPVINAELTRIGTLGKTPEEIGAKYLAQLQEIADRVIKGAEYTGKDATELRRLQNQYEAGRQGKAVQVIDPATGQPMDANAADMSLYLDSIAKQYELSTKDLVTMILDQLTNPEDPTQPMNPAVEAAMRGITIDGKNPAESKQIIIDLLNPIKELVSYYPELNGIKDVMGAIGNETELMANAITSALGSGKETLDDFFTTLGATATALNNDKELIGEMSNRFGEMSPDAKRAFDIMIANGVELQDALRIVSMVISDVNTDWAALADMARRNPAEFRATVWTSYVEGAPLGSTPTAKGATAPTDSVSAAIGAIDYSGGSAGGDGGGSGSDYYDKLIAAQDKIIEKIQKEREERQKLLDLQEKQVDFALRQQDLENQIARAVAEGNFAEAALLQAQLDAEKQKYQAQEIERRRQEREDRKIAAAEKEKERLGKLKDASSGGGGGGGASAGISESQKQWTANRIEILTGGVVNWTEGAEIRRATFQKGPWSAFFESDQVKQYRQELEKLNVPAENIDAILNDLYDSWINNNSQLFAQTDDYKFIEDSLKGIGIEGDNLKKIMPEVFGAILDKNLNPKEKINIIAQSIHELGYNSDEAYRKAKKLYNQYGEDFNHKGIDGAIAKWIEWNDIVKAAQNRLHRIQKQLSEGATLQDLGFGLSAADRLEGISMTAAGQSTADVGQKFNAGGVMLTGKQIGSDLMAGVTEGLTSGVQAHEAAARTAVRILEKIIRDETQTNSPSKVYELVGKDLMAGLVNGLVLPPDSALQITNSLFETFQNAIESYKTMFTDPTAGINGVLSQEITLASDNFYTKMTTRMKETIDEINRILTNGIKDYTFQIIGDPKIYDGGARDVWQRVFQGMPASIFTTEMPQYAEGGYVTGPGGPTEDKILAKLSNGEYVIKASSVDQYGTQFLDQINNKKFAGGGLVGFKNGTSNPTYYPSADRAETAANNNVYAGGASQTYTVSYSNNNASRYNPQPGVNGRDWWSQNQLYNLTQIFDKTKNDKYYAHGPYSGKMYYFGGTPTYQGGYTLGDEKWNQLMLNTSLNGYSQYDRASMFEQWRDLRRWEKDQLYAKALQTFPIMQQYDENQNRIKELELNKLKENYLQELLLNSNKVGNLPFEKFKPIAGPIASYPNIVTLYDGNYLLVNGEYIKLSDVNDPISASKNYPPVTPPTDYGIIPGTADKSGITPYEEFRQAYLKSWIDTSHPSDFVKQYGLKALGSFVFGLPYMPLSLFQTANYGPKPIPRPAGGPGSSQYPMGWDTETMYPKGGQFDYGRWPTTNTTAYPTGARSPFPWYQRLPFGKFSQGGIIKARNGTYISADRAETAAQGNVYGGYSRSNTNIPGLFSPGSSQDYQNLQNPYNPKPTRKNIPFSMPELSIPGSLSHLASLTRGAYYYGQNFYSLLTNDSARSVASDYIANNPKDFAIDLIPFIGSAKQAFEAQNQQERDMANAAILFDILGLAPFGMASKFAKTGAKSAMLGSLKQILTPKQIMQQYATATAGNMHMPPSGFAGGGLVGFKDGTSNPTWYSADRAEQEVTGNRGVPTQSSTGANPWWWPDQIITAKPVNKTDPNKYNAKYFDYIGKAFNPLSLMFPNINMNQEGLTSGWPSSESINRYLSGAFSSEMVSRFYGKQLNIEEAKVLREELGKLIFNIGSPGGSLGRSFYSSGATNIFSDSPGEKMPFAMNESNLPFWRPLDLFTHETTHGLNDLVGSALGSKFNYQTPFNVARNASPALGKYRLPFWNSFRMPPKTYLSSGAVDEWVNYARGDVSNKSDRYNMLGYYAHGINESSAMLYPKMIQEQLANKYGMNVPMTIDRNTYYPSPDSGGSPLVPAPWAAGELANSVITSLKQQQGINQTLSQEALDKIISDQYNQLNSAVQNQGLSIPSTINDPYRLTYYLAPDSIRKMMLDSGFSVGYGLDEPAWRASGGRPALVGRAAPSRSSFLSQYINRILQRSGRFASGGLVRVGADNLTILGEGISKYASGFTGTPYSSSGEWADGPKNGWGCATATRWLYDSYAGVNVGNDSLSAGQYASSAGSIVSTKQPGDLLFFYYPNGVNTENPINHVGMYTGAGQMFHARSPQLGTQITGIDEVGMDRAVARAGGTGIKRYLPMTIAGMGIPTGKLAKGGRVYGKGGPTTDEILAWISNGEYVMSSDSVNYYGKDFMDAVNKGILPEAARGGMFSSKYPGVVQRMASGGMLMSKYGKGGTVSSSPNIEYNINVNVEGTNASTDEIANAVMQSLQRKERMNKAVTRI